MDRRFDRPLEGRSQEAKRRTDMHLVLGERDLSADAGALEIQCIAVPGMGDAEFFGDTRGHALDRCACVLEGLGVLALDVDPGHARIVRPACGAC